MYFMDGVSIRYHIYRTAVKEVWTPNLDRMGPPRAEIS